METKSNIVNAWIIPLYDNNSRTYWIFYHDHRQINLDEVQRKVNFTELVQSYFQTVFQFQKYLYDYWKCAEPHKLC